MPTTEGIDRSTEAFILRNYRLGQYDSSHGEDIPHREWRYELGDVGCEDFAALRRDAVRMLGNARISLERMPFSYHRTDKFKEL